MGANASMVKQTISNNISNSLNNSISSSASQTTRQTTSCDNDINLTMRNVIMTGGCNQNMIQKCDVEASLDTLAQQNNTTDLANDVSNNLSNTMDSIISQTVGLGLGGNLSNQEQTSITEVKTSLRNDVSSNLQTEIDSAVRAANRADIDMEGVVFMNCGSGDFYSGKRGTQGGFDSSFLDDPIDQAYEEKANSMTDTFSKDPFGFLKHVVLPLSESSVKNSAKEAGHSKLKTIENIANSGNENESATDIMSRMSNGGQNIAQVASVSSVSKNVISQETSTQVSNALTNVVENAVKATATQKVDALGGLAFLAFLPLIFLVGGIALAAKMLLGHKGSQGGSGYEKLLKKRSSEIMVAIVIAIVLIRKS